ncbi:MAG: P1 family peptidase [Gemmatimonadales bacterium]|nr:MAG: P1 family peptidase [Gemmatimonadales bacterium]
MPQSRRNVSLTAIPGIRVGHALVPGGGSGCTAILGPFRGAVRVTGMATGTRELGTLHPEHLVREVNAVVLSGGSAYGLAAAHGVMAWLAERGEGFPTGADVVPIVPAAILYDLAPNRSRPDAATGFAAAEAASDAPVAEGRVGAGAGATVGKLAGPERAMPGGLGSWLVEVGGYRIGALVAVNAVGDVLDGTGQIVAGARDADGTFLDGSRLLRESPGDADPPMGNTTLCVVATDAPVDQRDLYRIVRGATGAMPRRIRPVNTPMDGDVIFGLAPSREIRALADRQVMALGDGARVALEEAITRAVLPEDRRG